MKNKFILEFLESDDNGMPLCKEYKTLKDIAKDLNLEYYQIIELRNNSLRQKKFLHNQHKHLALKYRIIDNPKII